MKLSIIIPVYNEERYIGAVVQTVLDLKFEGLISELEVILVDDGSSDDSYSIISDLAEKFVQVSSYRMDKNSGKGAAVRHGFSKSTGDLLIVQDSDLELVPEDILPMVDLQQKHQLVLVNGSRFLKHASFKDNSSLRNTANRLFSMFISVMHFKKITDLTCGYKLISRDFYERLHLKEDRFGTEAELLSKALKYKKSKVQEYPVRYYPREVEGGKKIRPIDGFRILWATFKYRFVN